jgi:hypothetical protein
MNRLWVVERQVRLGDHPHRVVFKIYEFHSKNITFGILWSTNNALLLYNIQHSFFSSKTKILNFLTMHPILVLTVNLSCTTRRKEKKKGRTVRRTNVADALTSLSA